MTAYVACPCLSSPDSDFFWVVPITENWGGEAGEWVVSEGHACEVPARTEKGAG